MTTCTEINVKEIVPETESQFFVVRTVREAADTLAEALTAYREKYVGGAVEKGRTFGKGVKKDALVLRERISEKGRSLMPDRLFDRGKSLMPEIPSAKEVEEKVGGMLNRVADKVNLPSRKDIDKLTQAMETLSGRVDALRQNYSA